MNIRHVEPTELSQLLALLRPKAEFDGCLESIHATVASLRSTLFADKPLAYALVAEAGGQLIGMATYYAIFASFIAKPGLWLDDLFVDPGLGGHGTGRQLMQRLCLIARASGCARVDRHVSRANERGIRFYRGIGAIISEKAQHVRLGEAEIHALADECIQATRR